MSFLSWYRAYWQEKYAEHIGPFHRAFSWMNSRAIGYLRHEWEDLRLASEECRVRGFPKFLIHGVSEIAACILIVGAITASVFKPVFQIKPQNWLRPTELSIGFLDESRGYIGLKGLKQDISVPLSAMPQHFLDALLAAEDPSFFENEGYDLRDVKVALNLAEPNDDDLTRARPTIALQLARQIFLSNERRSIDQIRENALAYWLGKHFHKDELLKLYVDRSYLGLASFGVSAAARTYFGKNIQDLNLTESAMLAGLFANPTAFSPFARPEQAKARLQAVLSLMVVHGKISREEAQKALDVELPTTQPVLPGRSNDVINFG